MGTLSARIANRACRPGEAFIQGEGECFAPVILLGHPPVRIIEELGVFPRVSGYAVAEKDDMQRLMPDQPIRNISLRVGKIDDGISFKDFPCSQSALVSAADLGYGHASPISVFCRGRCTQFYGFTPEMFAACLFQFPDLATDSGNQFVLAFRGNKGRIAVGLAACAKESGAE